MYIYNEDELAKKLDLLNALLNPYFPWRYTTARKDQEDLFGITIKEGKTYFKRECGAAWDNVIKMSRESMDKFIYVLFNGDFCLQKLTETSQDNRFEEFKAQMKKLKI